MRRTCEPSGPHETIDEQMRTGGASSSSARASGAFPWKAAVVLALACAGSAAAQNSSAQETPDLTGLSLDELLDADVVYAAAKQVQTLREAPSAVTVVTAAEIRQHGYRTLADVLRTMPGFYVTSDRNYSYVGVRGFDQPGDYSTRILILLNGLRTNDNIYDQAYVGNEFVLDADLIDRIEVVRGPSAALYGNSAFLAVVNVITKKGRDLQGGELSLDAGGFAARSGRATYGRRLDNGLELLVSGTLSRNGGQRLYFPEFDDPATQNGIADHIDDEGFSSAFASLARGNLAFEASLVSRDKGVPTASFGTVFGHPSFRTTDKKHLVSLTYERGGQNGAALTGRIHYGRWEYRGLYPFGEGDSALNDDSAVGAWWGAEASLVRAFGTRHVVIAGAETQDNFRQDQLNFDREPRVVYQDSRSSSMRGAVFAQDEVTLTNDVSLHLGLRHDWYQTFGHATSPRVALIFGERKPTTIKALYGRAFRAPNAFELDYTGAGYKTNPLLKPETIETGEIVLERTVRPGVRLNASAYLNRIQDLISLGRDPLDGRFLFENAAATDSVGVEVGLEVKRGRATGRISYSLQRSHDQATEQHLTNSPRHLGKLDLAVPLLGKRLSAGLDAQYVSARRTLAGAQAPAFAVANLTLLAQRVAGRVDLSAGLYNAFDERYSDPGSEEHPEDLIQQDGRSFRIKASWRF